MLNTVNAGAKFLISGLDSEMGKVIWRSNNHCRDLGSEDEELEDNDDHSMAASRDHRKNSFQKSESPHYSKSGTSA
jgi:hypothetical protein